MSLAMSVMDSSTVATAVDPHTLRHARILEITRAIVGEDVIKQPREWYEFMYSDFARDYPSLFEMCVAASTPAEARRALLAVETMVTRLGELSA